MRFRRPVPAAAALLICLAGSALAAPPQPAQPSPAAQAREARIQRQLAAAPDALPTLADYTQGLPPFDIRLDPEGQPAPFVADALAALHQTDAWKLRSAAAAALRDSLPELAIDDAPLFATPQFVRSTRTFLTGPDPARDAHDLAARYIADHAALFEIDALEIPLARVTRDYRTARTGVRHLTFQQRLQGRDLAGCELRANLMPDGRLISIGGSMLPRPEGDFVTKAATLTAADAVAAAAATVGLTLAAPPVPLTTDATSGLTERTIWAPIPGLRPDEPVVTTAVYFSLTRTDIRPAFTVVIPVPGLGHTYDLTIDATDGSLLTRHNRLVSDTTQPATYRVYTSDGVAPGTPAPPAPTGFQAPFVPRELVTVQPSDISVFSPNGWIPDGESETIGNNVAAHLDLDANNLPDLPRPNGGPTRTFDFPLDPTLAPSTFQQASAVQLFYWANLYHDRLSALGFDEAAGNFQTVNFSGMGTGGDAIQLDAQDGNGLGGNANNANFNGTGTDGSPARVQMYLFTGPNPDRDGTLEGDIVYHELTHGTSIRLHGGLTATQSRGQGEGWSDFVAFCLLAEPSDDPAGAYPMGGFTTNLLFNAAYTNNYYFGIRRYPYSTNLLLNPLTLADIDPARLSYTPGVPRNTAISTGASAVHNVGEVWCSSLLEARAQLIARDGFAGNETMLRLVIEGMELTTGQPNFVASRDAILLADMATGGGVSLNRIPLWTGFAKRGLGEGAITLSSTNTVVGTESFITPFRARFDYPDGLPTILSPGVPTTIRVDITPIDLTLTPGTERVLVRIGSAPEVALPLTLIAPGQYTATLPAADCFDRIQYRFAVDTSMGLNTGPAPAFAPYSAPVNSGLTTPVLADDFEADSGWALGTSTATRGRWERGDPLPTFSGANPSQTGDDHTPAPGINCWATELIGGNVGDADVDGGQTTLLSPIFDLSALGDARISYWRWVSNSSPTTAFTDSFRVDASTDGGSTWTNAESLGTTSGADVRAGWRQASWSLLGIGLAPTATVRFRFIAEDVGAGSIMEAALDDFAIEAVLCTPPTCPADFNDDGGATVQDIFDFLSAYFSNDPTADFNTEGGITVQDIFDFLSAYFAGCP